MRNDLKQLKKVIAGSEVVVNIDRADLRRFIEFAVVWGRFEGGTMEQIAEKTIEKYIEIESKGPDKAIREMSA